MSLENKNGTSYLNTHPQGDGNSVDKLGDAYKEISIHTRKGTVTFIMYFIN